MALLFILIFLFVSCQAMEKEKSPDLKFNTSTSTETDELNLIDFFRIADESFVRSDGEFKWAKEIIYPKNKEISYYTDENFPKLPLNGEQFTLALSPDKSKIAALRLWKYLEDKSLQIFIVDRNKKTYFESPRIFSMCKNTNVFKKLAVSCNGLCAIIRERENTNFYDLLVINIKTKKKQQIATSLQKDSYVEKALAFNAAGTHIALRIVASTRDETEIYALDSSLKEE